MKPNSVILDRRKERTYPKLRGYISQITGFDDNDIMMRRSAFMQKHLKRVEYLDALRDEGYYGKAYSDAVVAYDKQMLSVN